MTLQPQARPLAIEPSSVDSLLATLLQYGALCRNSPTYADEIGVPGVLEDIRSRVVAFETKRRRVQGEHRLFTEFHEFAWAFFHASAQSPLALGEAALFAWMLSEVSRSIKEGKVSPSASAQTNRQVKRYLARISKLVRRNVRARLQREHGARDPIESGAQVAASNDEAVERAMREFFAAFFGSPQKVVDEALRSFLELELKVEEHVRDVIARSGVEASEQQIAAVLAAWASAKPNSETYRAWNWLRALSEEPPHGGSCRARDELVEPSVGVARDDGGASSGRARDKLVEPLVGDIPASALERLEYALGRLFNKMSLRTVQRLRRAWARSDPKATTATTEAYDLHVFEAATPPLDELVQFVRRLIDEMPNIADVVDANLLANSNPLPTGDIGGREDLALQARKAKTLRKSRGAVRATEHRTPGTKTELKKSSSSEKRTSGGGVRGGSPAPPKTAVKTRRVR